jgi:ATP synthase subunit 6
MPFFTSPLEQFQVLPLYSFYSRFFDFTITNETIIFIFILSSSFIIFSSLSRKNDNSFLMVPTHWQSFFEILYLIILNLVVDNIKSKKAETFFPFIFYIFFLLLSLNLIGLIPYSFTVTSHLIVTIILSICVFIGINILCIKWHKSNFFALFLPSGTSIFLAFLLIPIELISYVFKPISLSIRLFANMMAGHTLLKVIAGFSFTLMNKGGVLFFLHYIPLFILIPLCALEFGVSLIQSFVFSVLLCIYLNDSINLH